jgi:hypothetical protein
LARNRKIRRANFQWAEQIDRAADIEDDRARDDRANDPITQRARAAIGKARDMINFAATSAGGIRARALGAGKCGENCRYFIGEHTRRQQRQRTVKREAIRPSLACITSARSNRPIRIRIIDW